MEANVEKEYNGIMRKLEEKKFLSTDQNNEIVKKFFEAKINGGYGRLVYDKVVGIKTIAKKARSIKKVDDYFRKDISELTEKDIIEYRNMLNNNKVMKYLTKIKWNQNKVDFKVNTSDTPISYRTKADYRISFCELYQFYIEYRFQEEGKILPDITRFFKITRPSNYEDVKVEFIRNEDIEILLQNIKNRDFKALIQLSIMSGGRPCEMLNIRFGENLYKNNKGKWVIKLPKMKGISGKKYPIEIDLYLDELAPYFERRKLKAGELLFAINDGTFRSLMKYYTKKYINKEYSPKILRKTARMIRSNAGFSYDYINKLMGHNPGSKIQQHYTNFDGIESDQKAVESMNTAQSPTLRQNYEDLKLKYSAQQKEIEDMKDIFKQLKGVLEDRHKRTKFIEMLNTS